MSDEDKKDAGVTVDTSTKPDTTEKKKFKPLTEDPYTYADCIISATINWMPEDGEPGGRQMVIAVRNHQDQPIVRFCREAELSLEDIPELLGDMLNQLREDMPNRKMAMLEAKANEKKKKSPAPAATAEPEGTIISTSTPFEITKNGSKKPVTATATGQQSLF
ncbi:MAG: hypothetical protein RBT34_00255 [Anaerolineaceae bacterium]|jgi:hypothetical protein|nr:hypothetical protein [Anaerolineaceae bacterium]